MSREEELLRGLIDGASVDVEPQSRSEAYLKAMIDGDDVSELGEPQSRIEELYSELADVIEGGGGGGGSHTLITPLSVEENGTYTAPEGTAYSPVTVNVPTGGGGSKVEEKDVNFYDYDGTVLYSYTKNEFLALDTMPGNPDRTDEGLTAQGWNWTYTEARNYVQKYGICDIGQMYDTTDGKTRIYVDLIEYGTSPSIGISINGTMKIDWGDGSPIESYSGTSMAAPTFSNTHNYATHGQYVITIETSGQSFINGPTSSLVRSRLLRSTNSDVSVTENYKYGLSITKVNVGSGITRINDYGFADLDALEYVTIPNTMIAGFGVGAFTNCSSLKCLVIPRCATTGGNVINSNCCQGMTSASKILLAGDVVKLQSSAFKGCNSLSKKICIPESVTLINTNCFSECKNLEEVFISDSVVTLGTYAFQNCYRLKKIRLPKAINSIQNSSLYSCRRLTTLVIPDTVTSLGTNCIAGTLIYEIHFKSMSPPSLANSSVLSALPAGCKIYVPTGTLEAYTSASNYPSPSTYTYIEE